MAAVFPASVAPKAFDGLLLLSVDGGATVWALPNASCVITDSDNISRPSLMDSSEIIHNEVPGIRMGTLSVAAPIAPDRGIDTFLSAAHGPRTGQGLTPFIYNILPYNGGGLIKGTGLWIGRTTLYGQFGVSGQQAMNMLRFSGQVADVDNVFLAPTLVAPAVAGKNGLGLSSFATFSATNSGATNYKPLRSFSLTLDNALSVIPGIIDTTNRLCAGCQPGQLRGALTLEQLAGAPSPLPGARGLYPFTLAMKTGDGTKTLSIDLSTSRDGSSQNMVPEDFIARGQAYSLFGTNAGNSTGTAGWLYVATYA